MNTMNIPGFTADTSIYKTRGHYRAMASHPAASANKRAVLPQLPRQLQLLQCLQDCSLADSSPFCQQLCFWQDHINTSDDFFGSRGGGRGSGGGSGGGGGQSCVPECGPCIDGSRLCVRHDCSDYDRPCGIGGRHRLG